MASSSTSLAELLSHPAIWRGGDCAPEPAALPTGHPALDAVLPGGGWPQAALTEVLIEREGIGELRLALPALARMTHAGRAIVWVSPPHRPYAPALAQAGLDLAHLIVVRCRDLRESLWAYEQALRAPDCGAAFGWMSVHEPRALRRLQVAAREGRTWGVLWRRPGERPSAAAAPLRLALSPHEGRLAVRILKRRGAELPHPVLLDIARVPGAPLVAGAPGASSIAGAPGAPPIAGLPVAPAAHASVRPARAHPQQPPASLPRQRASH
jgi:hypothetical protein